MSPIIIVCKCRKKLVFTEQNKSSYTCPHCGLIYCKEYYLSGGEYKYTFILQEKK